MDEARFRTISRKELNRLEVLAARCMYGSLRDDSSFRVYPEQSGRTASEMQAIRLK